MDEVSSVCSVGEEEEEEEKDCDEEEEEYKTELTEKFTKLLDELVDCNEDEQKQKIDEMNEMVNEMNEKEFHSICTKKNLDKINKMIEEKKITLENTMMLMRHIAYCNALAEVWCSNFHSSELSKRFEKMIVEEDEKKEEKNERLLVDLCECHLITYECYIPDNIIVICILHLLKAASNKEENEETKEEVEMALLALTYIVRWNKVERELYLNEIKEIIQHHQEHHNLTHLAYQSTWQFLINRFEKDESLEDTIMNELHIIIEAIKELEELTRNVNWKKKNEREEKGTKTKEEIIIWRWFDIISDIISQHKLWNEEFVGLIGGLVGLYRAANDGHREICRECIYFLRFAARSESMKVDDLLEGGAIDTFFEELHQPTLEDENMCDCLDAAYAISGRLEGKTDGENREDENGEEIRKKVFEKMEEEGYEDTITSFYETIDFLNNEYYYELSLDISDYFVNI
ncbi:uncharacterized protein MONOS_2564 [Monocercomonoides exilis]|uniref:uncharacterized protein n=1 Tax=Monocercomonoides exilis TaxID=2049356 RepID=UPI00355A5FF2|nr:hypothetical protein MONOS_2564 [Monocercomonoides exilis]|eukprot:MONOS_2564.1-p1 / transcript=MONOS_2564.1 / gene=MONOS_2564 / organism=Monocercomonoides_exilis_PA203 / gene_product=unspecified product / transcript_product=unspecified product / location=Mono_scaffold00053:146182-147678(+) / protein_length=460 / sequence_SO=supercontig / SO=protein_coding / is_pseudo=false